MVDLAPGRRVHIVGIGGAGMSSIATVLAGMGLNVSGSDLKHSPVLDRLASLGVSTAVGHEASHVGAADVVAVSTAIGESNPEVRAARAAGIAVVSRATLLAALCARRSTVAVAGTHGKTTTSSMLALVLVEAGLEPSFVIGGDVNEIGGGAALGSGRLLVVEADESDGTFLQLGAEAAVVTNVEPDHIDHYGSVDALVDAFREFARRVEGPVIACADDPGSYQVASVCAERAVTYGTSEGSHYRIVGAESGRSSVSFTVAGPSGDEGRFTVPAPGMHVARNATAALAAGIAVGADVESARRALARFSGVARRFQVRGSRRGVTFVDDYAHLPGEIAATIAAAQSGRWGRIVCVFQPHRYSRVAVLGGSYGRAFLGADAVVVTDVYAAGEAPVAGVTGEVVAESCAAALPGVPVRYVEHRSGVGSTVAELLRSGDLCLVLSAGDLVDIGDEVYPDAGDG